MANNNPTNTFADRPQDINRKGRPPRGWTWADIFEKEVEKLDIKDKKQIKRKMVNMMIRKVLEGDVQAFKEIANRMDGLPKQSIDLSTLGESLNYDEEQSRKIADRIIARGKTTSGASGEKLLDRLQHPDQ